MLYTRNQKSIFALLLFLLPIFSWLWVAEATEDLYSPKYLAIFELIQLTPHKPLLISALLAGILLAIFAIELLSKYLQPAFRGAPFKTFIRGTTIVKPAKLYRMTKTHEKQISIAGIPQPYKIEPLHLLLNGATGTGKSVMLRELVMSAIARGDRLVIVDPNGDMYSRFGTENDLILNPYDKRTQGWSFFNEIRNEYDFHRYALSVVPRGRTEEAEEWAGYGRLLLRETAKKLTLIGNPSIQDLFHWTTLATPEDLKEFLQGTLAESLFVGSSEASRALSSARFVLSDKLSEHCSMPKGDFSIRQTGGQRRYDVTKLCPNQFKQKSDAFKTLTYARVSSSDQKSDLLRQEKMLEMYCVANGWSFETISDLGSGMNYQKRGLKKLIQAILARKVNRLVLTHKDRLLRFGADLIFSICELYDQYLSLLRSSGGWWISTSSSPMDLCDLPNIPFTR